MKKDLKLAAVNTDEAEGQLVMDGMPEPVTVYQVEPEPVDQDIPVPVEYATPAPEPTPVAVEVVKKSAGKPVASDKTVIKNLRAEVRKLTEELAAAHEALDIQEQKNVILFNQRKDAQLAQSSELQKLDMAQEILHTGIVNTLNAFNAILRK